MPEVGNGNEIEEDPGTTTPLTVHWIKAGLGSIGSLYVMVWVVPVIIQGGNEIFACGEHCPTTLSAKAKQKTNNKIGNILLKINLVL